MPHISSPKAFSKKTYMFGQGAGNAIGFVATNRVVQQQSAACIAQGAKNEELQKRVSSGLLSGGKKAFSSLGSTQKQQPAFQRCSSNVWSHCQLWSDENVRWALKRTACCVLGVLVDQITFVVALRENQRRALTKDEEIEFKNESNTISYI